MLTEPTMKYLPEIITGPHHFFEYINPILIGIVSIMLIIWLKKHWK